MQGCNGDIHSHIHPKHALANNNSNNSCYVGTLLRELKCSFELIFNDRVKRDGETVALGEKKGRKGEKVKGQPAKMPEGPESTFLSISL